MAFERSESIVKSVRPCTLLTANFGKTKISLLHGIYRHPWRQPLFSRVLSHKTMFFFYFAFSAEALLIFRFNLPKSLKDGYTKSYTPKGR